MTPDARVRAWLVVAVVAVLVEQSFVRYSSPGPGPHLLWLAVSAVLLYRVSRGGNIARCCFLALALFGAIIYAMSVPNQGRVVVVMLALLVQAATMLVPAVRSWTRPHDRAERETPFPAGA